MMNKRRSGAAKLIIIIVLAVVVLAGGFVALRFVAPGLIPGWGEKKATAGGANGTGGAQPPGLGELYPMKSFIVNLADPAGRRYLKLTLSFELGNPDLKMEMDNRQVQIQDGILTVLRSQTYESISSVEGEMRLKAELLGRVNSMLKTGKISNVYFSEFVVQ